MEKETDNRDIVWRESMTGCLWYVMGIAVGLLFCALLGSCGTTKYVPVVEHRTDTVRVVQHERDSIYLHDSIYVSQQQRGDTVWLTTDRWHTQWRDRWRHDTLYQSRVDSVPAPYPVEVKVPAELTQWQRARISIADILLGVLAILGVAGIVKLIINNSKFKI